ncbi:MAG TPA: tRNA (adenosine(37)-N6)-threonylcarbamoyltransferase complex dimerization subunit type 1 TsaB [Polyangiaceae bacterium]|nr:tRNA (adenosine(37)-N6)-threonylcarbamoyltransferase complex dimerization subunit type 1 TsaB [Polyangiaceae bacterium]
MRALAIDTSAQRAAVVLVENGALVAREENLDPAQHAERLFDLASRAFATAGWLKNQLDVVTVCTGPGSFTGIRVGLASAKGIALGLDRPIVGVGSLEAMAGAARSPRAQHVTPEETVVALLDARKGEVFWAAFDAELVTSAGPAHVTADRAGEEIARLVRAPLVIVGAVARDLATGSLRVIQSKETNLPDALFVARLGTDKLVRRGADDVHALEPIYVRPPDVTMPKA